MNSKILRNVIAVENRVNTICKCLVLGEADHFHVEYNNYQVTITAFSYQKGKTDRLTDLMRIYAEPEDKIVVKNFSGEDRVFWTSEISIPLN